MVRYLLVGSHLFIIHVGVIFCSVRTVFLGVFLELSVHLVGAYLAFLAFMLAHVCCASNIFCMVPINLTTDFP